MESISLSIFRRARLSKSRHCQKERRLKSRSLRISNRDMMSPLLYILIGLAVGMALGWLVRAVNHPAPDHRVEAELRQQLAQRDAEVSQLRSGATGANEARASAEARQ